MNRLAIGYATAALFASFSSYQLSVAQTPAGTPATPGGDLAKSEPQMFSRTAEYERYMGRWSRQLVPGYIAFAEIQNGDHVLDVGTGTGALASGVAAKLPDSRIVGVDPAQVFIDYARKSLPSERVRFELGDAQSLKFPDATFDQTMALLVMNFIPDPEKGLREMRRVTRLGGTVSACVWDYDIGMEMIRYFWDEAVAVEPSLASKDQRNTKFAHKGELNALWKKVGLVNVEEKPVVIEQNFSSFDDYWQPFLGRTGAAGALVATLGETWRQQIETRLRKRLLGDRADGPIVLKARAWCVRGNAV